MKRHSIYQYDQIQIYGCIDLYMIYIDLYMIYIDPYMIIY
jgi:hypothetical protein